MLRYKYFTLFFLLIFMPEILCARKIPLKQLLEMPRQERLKLLVNTFMSENSADCPEALSGNNITESTRDSIDDNLKVFMRTLYIDDPKMFELLLKVIEEGNLNIRGEHRETILNPAIRFSYVEMVRFLIEAGANINEVTGTIGRTPLHTAALVGNLEIVEALIEAGADVNAQVSEGTPLHFAAWTGNLEVVKALIKAGADIDAQGDFEGTPLHAVIHAVLSNDSLEALKSWEKKPVVSNQDRLEVIKVLIEAGADVNARYHRNQQTPLHLAADSIAEFMIEIIKALIAKDADPNIQDRNGNTPLHLAILKNHPEAVIELMKVTDLSIRNGEGKTPEELTLEKEQQANE